MLSTENDLRKRVPYTNGYSGPTFSIGWVNRLDTTTWCHPQQDL